MDAPRNAATQALLFDLGGVVIDIDVERMLRHWLPYSRLSLDEMKQRLKIDLPFEQYERGELSTSDYMGHLSEVFVLDADWETVATGWNALLVEQIDHALDLVASARRHLPCHAFSNTSASHHKEWGRRFPRVIDSFQQLFLSFEMGMRKPDPAAFLRVAEQIGVEPASILFFDDTLENVEGARSAGLCAVHVRSTFDVERALAGIGAL